MNWKYFVTFILFSMSSLYVCNLEDLRYADIFYGISVNQTANTYKIDSLQQIQLIRIPKASSSSLSIIARRYAGCSPPGPCCKWPGLNIM